MFRQVSSNVLLKSVVVVVSAALVGVLASGAWHAWGAVATASRLQKLAVVASDAFSALHNLRLDHSLGVRVLNLENPGEAGQIRQITQAREEEFPALQATIAALRAVDIPDRDALVDRLDRTTATLAALAKESAPQLTQPKSERRAGIAQDYDRTAKDLLTMLNQLSDEVVAQAKYLDPVVDQMMMMRDAVWLVRGIGGDIAIMVSNTIAYKTKLNEAQLQHYTNLIGRSEAAWDMVGRLRVGLPSSLGAEIDKAGSTYFASDFTAMRNRTIAAFGAGETPQITLSGWTGQSVPRLEALTALAEAALAAAQRHAGEQLGTAEQDLTLKLAMLAAAVAFAAAGFVVISRRVIRPLSLIQGAMMKVADGDLAVEVPYSDRADEIGALAQALATFKRNAGEKARIEAEQQSRSSQAVTRQKAVEAHIAAFESHVGKALQALSVASGDMRQTSERLSSSAEQTNRQAKDAAGSSSNASTNVDTVAVASQELSSSISEISRQVAHAASIAGRAVAETEETDATVRGLTEAAQRIGKIVSLINEIADQTNLLALNATIEAARAGMAGRGFAVVAAEVKSLANQTAKATGDISSQVGAIQEVAERAVQAMRRIGGTIGEVNTVATSIATAVEQQGAATQEITRNTQEAARRTGEVADNIAGVTAGADATGLAAADVRTSAEALSRQADTLRHEVDDFLRKIRAA